MWVTCRKLSLCLLELILIQAVKVIQHLQNLRSSVSNQSEFQLSSVNICSFYTSYSKRIMMYSNVITNQYSLW